MKTPDQAVLMRYLIRVSVIFYAFRQVDNFANRLELAQTKINVIVCHVK
jgi:hypothetical protein